MMRVFIFFKMSILLSFLFAGEIQKNFIFSSNALTFSQENGYDVVRLEGAYLTQDYGKPQVPVKVVNFLIPPSSKAVEINVLSDE